MSHRLHTGYLSGNCITVSRSTVPVHEGDRWVMKRRESIDDSLLSDLPGEMQHKVIGWIEANFIPSDRFILEYYTSYSLKHIVERDLGIYLTNNQMKDALLLCGYRPVNCRELNWRYKISPRSPAFTIDDTNRLGLKTRRQ